MTAAATTAAAMTAPRAQTEPRKSVLQDRDNDTLPALFFARARDHAGRAALRRKRLGLWEELTFGDYERGVRHVATALIDLGARPGEPIGLISDNRVEWLMADLGILSAGAVTCAMYTTSAVEQMAYVLGHSGARLLIVENEEQLDKALSARKSCPIERIVVMDRKGLSRFSDPAVTFWDDLLARGEALADKHAAALQSRMEAIRADNVAILIYTSGTTGPPKGVMLSHRNIVWTCRTLASTFATRPDDEMLSFLPLCHVAERVISVFAQVVSGSVVSFAESLDTVLRDLAEVRPHVFFAVPRIWEKLYNGIELRMRDATWAKRQAYAWAVSVGRQVNEHRQRRLRHNAGASEASGADGEDLPPALSLMHRAADQTVLGPLREKLGLDRIRLAVSGAAPISPDVVAYFQAIGVPLVEGYGMTESTAVATVNRAGQSLNGTVGVPLPGVSIRIADDGEILIHSPGVMVGYFKDPEATALAVDEEGWLHTGDVGEIDTAGRLKITDRKKDLIITSGGKNIAPQYIESKLRTSAYIHDAVVIGERRKYVSALIILDEDNLVAWAQTNRMQFGSYAELSRSADVRKLVDAEIETVNLALTHVEAIKKFRILEKRLDQDDGELTPTLKVRRRIVEERYKHLIDEMYRGG